MPILTPNPTLMATSKEVRSRKPKLGQKLRLSCDVCNNAKVKCTKEKPVCSRCKARGLQCVYGLSLRAGKRSAALGFGRGQTEHHGPKEVSYAFHTEPELGTERCHGIAPRGFRCPTPREDSTDVFRRSLSQIGDSDGTSILPGTETLCTVLQEQTTLPHNMGMSPIDPAQHLSEQLPVSPEYNSLASIYSTPSSNASPTPQTFDWQHSSFFTSTPTLPALSYSPTDASSASSTRSNTTAISTPDPYEAIPSSTSTYDPINSPPYFSQYPFAQTSIQTSMNSCLSNLNPSMCQCEASMHSAQGTLLRISYPEATSFDVALAANKEVLKRCSATIACGCIPYSDLNAISLTSTIARMISVYWASVSVLYASTHPDEVFNAANLTHRVRDRESGGALTMGAYKIDKADEERLKTEIVLIELEKLEKLVPEIKKGFLKAGQLTSDFQDANGNVHEPKISFWRSLTEFLTQSLRTASMSLRSKALEGDDRFW